MSKNKYVDFVSDEHFKKCVKWVCDAYVPKSDGVDIGSLQKNRIDPFKMVFDMMNIGIDVDVWLRHEAVRQSDKTINNRIGDFHQMLLGGVKGWTNLGVGDDTKLDLKKNDDSIFMELKNKFNTVNSDSLAGVRKKLENAIGTNGKSTSYWGYIIERNGSSGESEWTYGGKTNPRIKKIWGSKVYELVTKEPDALEKVWVALPLVIQDIINADLSTKNLEYLKEFFKQAFFNQ